MDKDTALKAALERAKERQSSEFINKIDRLICEIGKKSQELRELKLELASLEYKEPTLDKDIL